MSLYRPHGPKLPRDENLSGEVSRIMSPSGSITRHFQYIDHHHSAAKTAEKQKRRDGLPSARVAIFPTMALALTLH